MKVLFVEPPRDFWFVMGEYLPPPYGARAHERKVGDWVSALRRRRRIYRPARLIGLVSARG